MAPDPNSTSSGPREEASVKVPSKDPKKKDEKKDEDLVSFTLFSLFSSENSGNEIEGFYLVDILLIFRCWFSF